MVSRISSNLTIEKALTSALKAKYQPSAILLHGSRAVGTERFHSDWDIIMLFAVLPDRINDREVIYGQCVEWKAFQSAVSQPALFSTFGTYLQFARVLWEANNEGSRLLNLSRVVYANGPKLSEDYRRREELFFTHKLDGLTDDANTPELFFRHLCAIFNLSVKLWFELIEAKYSQPLYFAIPLIRAKDPSYSAHLAALLSSHDNLQKIDAAKQMFERLFQNNTKRP